MAGDWEVFSALVRNYAPRVEKVIDNARTSKDAAYTLLMSSLVEDFIDQVKANRADTERRNAVYQVGDRAPGAKQSTLGSLDPLVGTPKPPGLRDGETDE